MKEWLVNVIAGSLTLTIFSYLIPSGNIKKTVMVLFGFIFTAIIISPITSIDINTLGDKMDLIFNNITVPDGVQNEETTDQILNDYKNRVQEVICDYINKNSEVVCNKCIVAVNGDITSEKFGSIETVYCFISENNKNVLPDSGKHQIQQIIINIDGIHLNNRNENIGTAQNEKIQKLVAEYLHINESQVYIKEEGDK